MDRQKIESYIKKHVLTNVKKEDIDIIIRLLNKQHEICSEILNELYEHKRKINHWAWYVFPTDKPGISDPLQTYVTKDTAKILLKFAPNEWRLCLKKIMKLAIKKNYTLKEKVLPSIDIGRVEFFIKFWKTISNKPDWLSYICDVLEILINTKREDKKQEEINKIKHKFVEQTKSINETENNIKQLKRLIKKHFTKLENLKKLI
jgi:hypothetical protein